MNDKEIIHEQRKIMEQQFQLLMSYQNMMKIFIVDEHGQKLGKQAVLELIELLQNSKELDVFIENTDTKEDI